MYSNENLIDVASDLGFVYQAVKQIVKYYQKGLSNVAKSLTFFVLHGWRNFLSSIEVVGLAELLQKIQGDTLLVLNQEVPLWRILDQLTNTSASADFIVLNYCKHTLLFKRFWDIHVPLCTIFEYFVRFALIELL